MLHIQSTDLIEGYIYDGAWNLNESIDGFYNIRSMYSNITSVPWIWEGIHELNVVTTDNIQSTIIFDYESLQYETNLETIRTSIESSFNDALSSPVSITLDDDEQNFTLEVNNTEIGVTFKWSNSNCSGIFSKTIDDITLPNVTTDIKLPTKYINIYPKFLELHIAESISTINTTRISFPTLLLSIKDTELDNQFFIISETDELNISIFRTNIPIEPVPIIGEWDIII